MGTWIAHLRIAENLLRPNGITALCWLNEEAKCAYEPPIGDAL